MFSNKQDSKIKFKLKNEQGVELDFSGENLGESVYLSLVQGILAPTFGSRVAPPPINLGNIVVNDSMEEKQEEPVKKEEPLKRAANITPIITPTGITRKETTLISKGKDDSEVYSTDDTKENAFSSLAHLFPEAEKEVPLGNIKYDKPVLPIKEADREPDFFQTGIKYKGPNSDKPAYKLGYNCPKCGHSGRHYIPDFTKAVDCHNCHAKLRVEPATDNGFGVGDEFRDKHGNFFVANVLVIDSTPNYSK